MQIVTTDESAVRPTPNPPSAGRVWLGWWYEFWRGALLLGSAGSTPSEPGVVPINAPAPVRTLATMLEEYRRPYAVAAGRLGANFKGGYWMMYFAAPMAVLCSAASAVELAAGARVSYYGAEFALILWILTLFLMIDKGNWQRNWIRARRTSEHLRYLPLVAPFMTGETRNWYQELAARHGLRIIVDEEVTPACAWLGRTDAARALRLEDPKFCAGYRLYVEELLAQQIRYHIDKSQVERALSTRIGAASTGFLGITIICTATLFLGTLFLGDPWGFTHTAAYLRLLATVLPALGAGLRGLLAQGESHRVAELSEGMAKRLTQLRDQLMSLPADSCSTQELENVVWNAVQELLSEADTWMRLQESAPLSPAA